MCDFFFGNFRILTKGPAPSFGISRFGKSVFASLKGRRSGFFGVIRFGKKIEKDSMNFVFDNSLQLGQKLWSSVPSGIFWQCKMSFHSSFLFANSEALLSFKPVPGSFFHQLTL